MANKHRNWFWTFLGLTLCFMALIYFMSAQTPVESAQTSNGMISLVARLFYGSQTEWTDAMIKPVAILVRKTAHMATYAVLFLLSFGTVHFYGTAYGKGRFSSAKTKWLMAYGWAVFYAATDEFHQIFSGRGAAVADVAIDGFGAMIGTIALLGIAKGIRAKGAWRKAGWFAAALAGMFCIYALAFFLFHREVLILF